MMRSSATARRYLASEALLIMTDGKRKLLLVSGRLFVITGFMFQIFWITAAWWKSDSRIVCNRLHYWSEWIDCLHGKSHAYIPLSKIALFVRFIAAIAMLLGVLLPAQVSVLLPALVAALLGTGFIENWHTSVMPYAHFDRPELEDVFIFAKYVAETTLYYFSPVCTVAVGDRGAPVAKIGSA